MDLLKTLLCVMLLFLYQNCWAERATKNDSNNIKQRDDNRRANTRQSKIIEEDGTKADSKELHINDKTDVSIKIKPKPTRLKSSNNLRKPKNIRIPLIPGKVNASNIRPLDQGNTKESKVMKAIQIPIDLLIKDHDKDNNTYEAKSNIKSAPFNIKEQPKIDESDLDITEFSETEKDTDPKIDKNEEKIEPESQSSTKIIEDNSVIQDELDIRMGNECFDQFLNLLPHSTQQSYTQRTDSTPINETNKTEFTSDSNQENAMLPEYGVEKEKISINYSTNDNETLKEQIDSQATKIEIMINHLPSNATTSNPYSSIVIHNNTYQEITEPIYQYPYYGYPTYPNYYTYAQSNQYSQRPQHGSIKCDNWRQYYNAYPVFNYNDKSNRVWKTWNCMDIRIDPNERYPERLHRRERRQQRTEGK